MRRLTQPFSGPKVSGVARRPLPKIASMLNRVPFHRYDAPAVYAFYVDVLGFRSRGAFRVPLDRVLVVQTEP